MKKNRFLLLPVLGMLSVGMFISCVDDETTSEKSPVNKQGGGPDTE